MGNNQPNILPSSFPSEGPIVAGPGMPDSPLARLLRLWRRLWSAHRWWVAGCVGAVLVGGTVLVFSMFASRPITTVPESGQPQPQSSSRDSSNTSTPKNETTQNGTKPNNAEQNSSKKDGATGSGGQSGGTSSSPGGGSTGGGDSSGGACSGSADPWGGCWPGSTNTGVPGGVTLQRVPQDVTSGSGWSWNAGDQLVYITGAGVIVSGLDVSGGFYVTGAGSTIKNSKANAISIAGAARDAANPRLTIQDTEINCGNIGGTTAIGDLNFNALRINIHSCENGFDVDSDASITDSYIHDLYNSTVGDPHTDGLQSAVGSNLVLMHNVFYGFTSGCVYPNNGSCNGTSAININHNPSGPNSSNTTISNNLLAGGAYALYCPIPVTTNFKILNNHFSRVYSPNVGEFGPFTDCSNEIASGNVIHETGQALNLD